MTSEASSITGSDVFTSRKGDSNLAIHHHGTPLSSVHGNLMQSRHKQDPMKYYKVVAVMGEGSMGSVTKVKKADSARGGSARAAFVKEHQPCCIRFLSWLKLPGGYSKQKYIEINHSQGTNSTSGAEGSSSLSSSLRSLNSPATRALYGSYPPSRQVSQRGGSGSPMPTHQETHETEDTTVPAPPECSPPHSNRSNNKSPGSNPKQIHAQHSSLITYGTKKVTHYALKSIILDRCSSKEFCDELKNEVEILKSLDHPNIVRAIETFDYHNRLFIVLELCSGGDLYTRDPYTEAEARRIIKSLFQAVAYLHVNGIVHRDLKYENIMFVDESPDAEVRIIDFGLSQKFAANEHLHDAVGTVYTMAPELIGGDYDSKADIWSLGVISFMLLSSSMPFYGKDRTHVIKKILAGRYHFSSRRWKYVSNEAKHFVKTLLRRAPEKRPTANEALLLDWLCTEEDDGRNGPSQELLDNVQASIQAFAGYSTLKKLALMVVAYKSTSEEIGFLRKTFGKFDTSNDGEIEVEEFKSALRQNYTYTDEEMEAMFAGIDIDGTGKVHYIEFLAATIEAHGNLDEERIAEAFDRLDSDDSGAISVKNLKEFLGEDLPDSYVEKVIDEANIHASQHPHDHSISYDKFLALWDHDADEVMALAKQNVGSRRVSRVPSFQSSDSFDDHSTGTDLSSELFSTTSMGQPTTGSYYFKKHKELSVRQSNLESMSSARVDQVLMEHGLLPARQLDSLLNEKLEAVAAQEQQQGDGMRKTADI